MRYGLDKDEYRKAKKIWKLTVEQEIIHLKCEVASLKEHMKHCATEIKTLGERTLPESALPVSPIKGFETTTNPFLTNKNDNGTKKIDFTFQVTAALGNNDVHFEEPNAPLPDPSTAPTFGKYFPLPYGTYRARYRPTINLDSYNAGPFHPVRVNVRYNNITCMEGYSDKSFEELRLEDYAFKEKRLRSFNQGKLKDLRWGQQKPLRRFSYTRRDRWSPNKFGELILNRESNVRPVQPWSTEAGSIPPFKGYPLFPPWTKGAGGTPFTIRNQQNTFAPPASFSPFLRFSSPQTCVNSTSDNNQQDQKEVLNLVVSKLEKMEVQMTNVNAHLQCLSSQVSSMDSRLGFPRPQTTYMNLFGQESPLKEKVTLSPPKFVFSSPSTTDQSTSEMVQESTSFVETEKNTSDMGTNTPPLKVDIAVNTSVPLVSKETNTDQELMGSPKQMDISVPSIKFRFSSPILNENTPSFESKVDYNESSTSVNVDRSTVDENKFEVQDNEKNNNLFDLSSGNEQNLDVSDSNSNLATNANQIVIDKDVLKTEENISDSEKDFEIVEKEELAQEISSEKNKLLNLSSFGNQDSNLYNDVTEYMEIQLGKKKGEVYEFGFEVKADNVVSDASTSFLEGQAVNKDDSFQTFMSNLIDKSKSKHSSPSVAQQVSDSASKNSVLKECTSRKIRRARKRVL